MTKRSNMISQATGLFDPMRLAEIEMAMKMEHGAVLPFVNIGAFALQAQETSRMLDAERRAA